MLLFQKRFHEGLTSGAVTLTFRRWATCRVKPGGRYRCHPIGVLEVDEARQVPVDAITDDDAARAGFGSRAELVDYMQSASEEPLRGASLVWRIGLRHAGDGDRVSLALEDKLTAEDVRALEAQLARLDTKRPWTSETLALIGRKPRVAASQLAAELGRETKPFKADVVKLKKLGLTQSFEVGYEVSPRGRAYLQALASAPKATAKRKSTAAGVKPRR